MSDSQVVTELTVDAGQADEGLQNFQQAMLETAAVLTQMLSQMEGLQVSFKKVGDQLVETQSTDWGMVLGQQSIGTLAAAQAANENLAAASKGVADSSQTAAAASSALGSALGALGAVADKAGGGLDSIVKGVEQFVSGAGSMTSAIALVLGGAGLLTVAIEGIEECPR